MTKHCNHHLKRIFRQAGLTACFVLQEDSDIKRYALRQLGKHSRAPMVACATTSAKIAKVIYKVLHDNVIYTPLHDTMRKCGDTRSTDMVIQRCEQSFKLKEARKRANRFRKFTRQTVDELPLGEMKTMLAGVLKILDKALDNHG